MFPKYEILIRKMEIKLNLKRKRNLEIICLEIKKAGKYKDLSSKALI